MSLEIQRIPLAGPPLSTAYIDDHASVGSFYLAGPPNDIESYRRVADQIRDASPQSRWDKLADALTAPGDKAVSERLERVIRGRGVFVSTGQQAGLFVSPLFTLYKAFTAARLARQLEEQLGIPVMGLFSVASEDHDWNEVDHTHLIDLDNALARLSVAGPASDGDAPRPPVERIEVASQAQSALDKLTQLTPDSEFKASVLEPLRAAYEPGRSFAQAFQDALAALLQGHPILLARTADPYVKRETRDVLWSEWEKRQRVGGELRARSLELSKAGFESQVPVAEGTTNLFLEGRLGRDRIVYEGETPRLRRSGEELTEADLRRILDETPERLSPGALLRPVTEARAFPVVAYVGGPSEIAYLAQSQVLFGLHEVPAPVVVPRAAFRLIEPKVARALAKYGIRPDDLAGDATVAINRLLKDRTPPELRESMTNLRRSVDELLERVEAAAVEFDAGSKSAVGAGKRAVYEGIKALDARLQARVKEKHQAMQAQLEKAAVNMYPGGRPQERVLNPYPYLIRYGPGLLDRVYEMVVTPLDGY
jgi:bacillithiol biosynthesis cysteine-adding enzyme BshC